MIIEYIIKCVDEYYNFKDVMFTFLKTDDMNDSSQLIEKGFTINYYNDAIEGFSNDTTEYMIYGKMILKPKYEKYINADSIASKIKGMVISKLRINEINNILQDGFL